MKGELFLKEFPELDERAKRMFTETVQDLFLHCYVIRGGLIRSNPRFMFLDRHEDLVADYLALAGWKLHVDREQGIARFYHEEGSGRTHFNKDETILLLTLRLLYHEQKQTSSESTDCFIRIGPLREKLQTLLPPVMLKPFFAAKHLGRILRKLEQMRIIRFEGSSFQIHEDTTVAVLASIEYLVSQQSVEQTQARLSLLAKEEETRA